MDKRKLFTLFTEMIGDKLAGYDSMDNLLQDVVSTGKMAALLNSITAAQLLSIIGKNGSILYEDIVKACDKSDVTAEIERVARENEKNKVFNSEGNGGKIVSAEDYVKSHPEIFGESESKKKARKASPISSSSSYSGGCGSTSGYSYSGGCGGSSSYRGGC